MRDIFFDEFTGFTIGVTSNGLDVAIVIIDSTGTSIGAIAFPLDAFGCIIDVGVIGQAAFDASGLCGRSDDATLFLVADFFIEGVEFVDLTIGECFAVADLTTSALSQNGIETSEFETLAKSLHEEMLPNENVNPLDPSADFGNALNESRQNGLIE